FFTGINEKRPFGEKGIQLLIAKLRKATGLSFSAHTLRHSFATLMLEGGCDIYTLSNLMGHSKISTTTIYLQCNNYHKKRAIEKHILNYG
ncbi:MAG: tyrosine-type recombinase/integrase, partial [Cyanobacteria bacterium J06649_11]